MSLRQHRSHPRDWRGNAYVYPVISRRSGGLSIGINLSPDKSCNFACVYCQVDRVTAPRIHEVDPARLGNELSQMIADAQNGALFAYPAFADLPGERRHIADIAFSGDGEPTKSRRFRECVELAATLKHEAGLAGTRIVLITNSCYLTEPEVAAALAVMDANNGRIWAKLDAGTEPYHQMVNRPDFPLRHVIDNIVAAARVRPVVIQSLFMRLHGRPPDEAELSAYVSRLREITDAGGRIDCVQVYTVARRPAEDYVAPLTDAEVDHVVELVRGRGRLRADPFYGPG